MNPTMENYLKEYPNPFGERTSPFNCETTSIQGRNNYYTRNTGRVGNQLYEYVIWRLKALQDGKVFVNTHELPYPFDGENIVEYDRFGFQIGLPELIEPYPHNHEYYRNKLKIIKSFFPKVKEIQIGNNLNYTAIHIRMDDIFNYLQSYTFLPKHFYKNLTLEGSVLVIANCINEEQKKFMVDFMSFLADSHPKVVFSYKGNQSISDDFVDIIKAKKLICSTSTFWYFPALLSENIKEVVIPYYGVTKLMFPDCVEFPNKKTRFIGLPMRYKLKSFDEFWKFD